MEVDTVIKVTLTNEILKRISEIDENRFSLSTIEMPPITKNRLRKNSKKKSSYASNKIEGNPLTEKQANEAIDSDPHKHFLKPEQEVRNYFLALNLLEEKLKKKEIFSKEMILEVQAIVEKGASKEKIGLRGPMPPGVLFMDTVLMELVLWRNISPMIQMSIMHRCKWDYLHCIIQEEKILLIRKFGLIIF